MTLKCLCTELWHIVCGMKLFLLELDKIHLKTRSNVPARMKLCLGTCAHVPRTSGGLTETGWKME